MVVMATSVEAPGEGKHASSPAAESKPFYSHWDQLQTGGPKPIFLKTAGFGKDATVTSSACARLLLFRVCIPW